MLVWTANQNKAEMDGVVQGSLALEVINKDPGRAQSWQKGRGPGMFWEMLGHGVESLTQKKSLRMTLVTGPQGGVAAF